MILDLLATTGLPISTMRLIISVVRSRAEHTWREKAQQGINIYLEIAMMPGSKEPHIYWGEEPKGFGFTTRGTRDEAEEPKELKFIIAEGLAEYAMIFNLTKLFAPALHKAPVEATNG